jgi:hypothetical protein
MCPLSLTLLIWWGRTSILNSRKRPPPDTET